MSNQSHHIKKSALMKYLEEHGIDLAEALRGGCGPVMFPVGTFTDDISRPLDGADNLKIEVELWKGHDASPLTMRWRQARATLDGKVRDTFDAVLRWAIDYDLQQPINELVLRCPIPGSPREAEGAIMVNVELQDGCIHHDVLVLSRGTLIHAPKPELVPTMVIQDEAVFEVSATADLSAVKQQLLNSFPKDLTDLITGGTQP